MACLPCILSFLSKPELFLQFRTVFGKPNAQCPGLIQAGFAQAMISVTARRRVRLTFNQQRLCNVEYVHHEHHGKTETVKWYN
jgi:hypothetical protein